MLRGPGVRVVWFEVAADHMRESKGLKQRNECCRDNHHWAGHSKALWKSWNIWERRNSTAPMIREEPQRRRASESGRLWVSRTPHDAGAEGHQRPGGKPHDHM